MKKMLLPLLIVLLACLSPSLFAADGEIDAALSQGDYYVYLFDDTTYYLYNLNSNGVEKSGEINGSSFPGVSFSSFDAALNWGNGKAFFFKENQYIRFDMKSFRADPGYPKQINNTTWPGLPYSEIDAALNWGNGKVYFFNRGTYTRYDIAADKADAGYPQMISERTWTGLSFSTIDAAAGIDGSFSYLFSKQEYTKFNVSENSTFTGYPKSVAGNWNGVGGDGGSVFDGGDNSGDDAYGNSDDSGSSDITGTGFRVESFSLDLSPYYVKNGNSVIGSVQCAVGPDGTTVIGFKQENKTIVTWYDQSFSRKIRQKDLGNYWLSDMYVMSDGSVVVLLGKSINNTYLGEYPNALYIMKLDPSGREVFNTYIFGGEGHGPGKSWFDGRSKAKIAYNGSNFGVYFEVQKNWADSGQEDDIHNGDMFVAVTGNGTILEDTKHFWTASHSSTVQVQALDNGEFNTMTIGDAYPYGLQVYNRDRDKSFLAWPPEEDYIPYEDVNSTNAAGILEAIGRDGDDLIAFMGTLDHPNIGWESKVDPLFLKFDQNGSTLVKKYLEVSPNKDDSVITAAELGKAFLVGWGPGNDYDRDWEPQPVTAALIDKSGGFIIPPKKLNYPFSTYSAFTKIGPKSAVWFTAENGSSKVTGYIITID